MDAEPPGGHSRAEAGNEKNELDSEVRKDRKLRNPKSRNPKFFLLFQFPHRRDPSHGVEREHGDHQASERD